MHKAGSTLIPGDSQLNMGGIGPVDRTPLLAQVQSALRDVGAQKESFGKSHGDGSDSALDWDGTRHQGINGWSQGRSGVC